MAFQSPDWLSAICAAGVWRDASRLYTTRDGRQLVLPLVERTLAGVRERASLPYGWGFGGVIGETRVTAEDMSLVTADVASLGGLRTSVRPDPILGPQWAERLPAGGLTKARSAHVLDLSGGFEQVWTKGFTGSARTAVRKAERQQLDVEWDSTGRLLPIFYDLYEQSILRWNTHPFTRWRARRHDPMSKFRAVMDNAGRLTTIWVARHTGEPAAAIITVSFGQTMNYWRGAMNESLAGPSRANYLLHRLAIEKACLAGCTTYHMGETGSSASLSQFKSRFGARPMPYQELRIERIPFTRARDRAGSLIERGRRSFHVRGRAAGS